MAVKALTVADNVPSITGERVYDINDPGVEDSTLDLMRMLIRKVQIGELTTKVVSGIIVDIEDILTGYAYEDYGTPPIGYLDAWTQSGA